MAAAEGARRRPRLRALAGLCGAALLLLLLLLLLLRRQPSDALSEAGARTERQSPAGARPQCSPAPAEAEAAGVAYVRMLFWPQGTYGGGHWFHVAENFMVLHPRTRRWYATRGSAGGAGVRTLLAQVPSLGFLHEMNSMTRLLAAMGLAGSQVENIVFYHGEKEQPSAVSPVIASQAADAQLPPPLWVQVHRADMEEAFVVRVASQGDADKFVRSAPLEEVVPEGGLCALHMGAFGNFEHNPQRGHWFPTPDDVATFRHKMQTFCPRAIDVSDPTAALVHPDRMHHKRLVIYQRDLTRRLLHSDKVKARLAAGLGDGWTVEEVMHANDVSICELAANLATANAILTPHGFQSMLLLLLPPHALLFEVFPYRYYKRAYGPLAGEYGTLHDGIMSPATNPVHGFLLSLWKTESCMLTFHCRYYARLDDVELTATGYHRLITQLRHQHATLNQLADQQPVARKEEDEEEGEKEQGKVQGPKPQEGKHDHSKRRAAAGQLK